MLAIIKASCAEVNKSLGKLDPKIVDAIVRASADIASGKYDEHFVLDIFQTGSGTSTNMNFNEASGKCRQSRVGLGRGQKETGASERPREHGSVEQRHHSRPPFT